MADKTGQVFVTYAYDAWGGITSSTGSVTIGDGRLLKDVNPFRYAGYFYDKEIGLYYLKSREYSPTTGRFLTEDSNGNNLYVYCGNNPVVLVDPDGSSWFSDATKWVKDTAGKVVKTGKRAYSKAKKAIANYWTPVKDTVAGVAIKNVTKSSSDKIAQRTANKVKSTRSGVTKLPQLGPAAELKYEAVRPGVMTMKSVAKVGIISTIAVGFSAYNNFGNYSGNEAWGRTGVDAGGYLVTAILCATVATASLPTWLIAGSILGIGIGVDLGVNAVTRKIYGN